MKNQRKVCVFTGSRAEYGILAPILRRLKQDPSFDLRLVVAGTHLSLLHGETYRQIEEDGFEIEARVEMVLASDTPIAVTKSIALALIDLGGIFERLKPDLLLVLGDRSEVMGAAVAATVSNVPIAHIHGGEITRGSFDDQIRHAVTKLSHLHFTATEEFRRRVIQMGENPERVYTVGAPAIETIRSLNPLSISELELIVDHPLEPPVVVMAYHPVTLPGEDPEVAVHAILSALGQLEVGSLVLSFPNADPRFSHIRRALEEYLINDYRAVGLSSIGHRAYLSLLSCAQLMVGNSSAGLIEAPAFGTPAINVGIRQEGRPRADSVCDVPINTESIRDACRRALASEFQAKAKKARSPYDLGVSSATIIAEVLGKIDIGQLLAKTFYDGNRFL